MSVRSTGSHSTQNPFHRKGFRNTGQKGLPLKMGLLIEKHSWIMMDFEFFSQNLHFVKFHVAKIWLFKIFRHWKEEKSKHLQKLGNSFKKYPNLTQNCSKNRVKVGKIHSVHIPDSTGTDSKGPFHRNIPEWNFQWHAYPQPPVFLCIMMRWPVA